MKKVFATAVLLVLILSVDVFALEDDTLYKYVNFDACLSVGETQTYDRNDNKRGMVSIGGIWNFSLGLQYNRLRGELAYQERAEVSEIVQTMLGLVSTMTVRAAMANFYYDYVRSKHFAMYLGRIGPISMAIFFARRNPSMNSLEHANGKFYVG